MSLPFPQTSNNVLNEARGDIRASVGYDQAVHQSASVVADFLVANIAINASARSIATENMKASVMRTAALMAPYTTAVGFGNLSEAWRSAAASPDSAAQLHNDTEESRFQNLFGRRGAALLPGGVLPGAFRQVGSAIADSVHPGAVNAAESYAIWAQRSTLANLSDQHAQRLQFVATVHFDMDAFLGNRPQLFWGADGRLIVHLHVLSHVW